jgi:FAD:protein FMN transferase
MLMRRRTFIAAAVGSAAAGLAGWKFLQSGAQAGAIARSDALPSGERLYAGTDAAFGTVIRVEVLHQDQRQAELAIQDALSEAKKIDALMSIHQENSQVFRLNRDGRLHRPDAHLLAVLKQASELSELSKGAFDVTVQPLWLEFSKAAAAHALPSDGERLAAKSRVDWKSLRVTPDEIRFAQPDMAITLNGIAQGYAVDLALAAVRARGVKHALLDTGEFGALGAPAPGRKWTLGVQDPRRAGNNYTSALQMDGRSVATSGDYETAFTADFAHHHIFDPATGDSPPELASVTVVAPSGALADGLSTALFVMGAERAMRLVAQLDQVDVLLVDKGGKVWKSPGLPELRA